MYWKLFAINCITFIKVNLYLNYIGIYLWQNKEILKMLKI